MVPAWPSTNDISDQVVEYLAVPGQFRPKIAQARRHLVKVCLLAAHQKDRKNNQGHEKDELVRTAINSNIRGSCIR